MRFTFALLAFVASASAYSLESRQSLPNCAATCLADANLGGCGPADNKCLCNSPTFVSSTAECIAGACTGSDLINAQKAAQAICLSVGVTLTATSTSASGSTAASTPTTTSPASASSTGTTTSAGAAATTSSSSALSNGVNALAGVAAVALVGLTVL